MNVEKKIKDLYACDYIISDGELYPLQKWYNRLLDKTITEIDVCDVSRMIRQKEFMDIAIAKAINLLKANLFVGELYEGEILEKLFELDFANLAPYGEDLKNILSYALDKSKKHEWLCQEEQDDFEKTVKDFRVKLM